MKQHTVEGQRRPDQSRITSHHSNRRSITRRVKDLMGMERRSPFQVIAPVLSVTKKDILPGIAQRRIYKYRRERRRLFGTEKEESMDVS